jgi:hypothetical protein
MRIQFVLLIVLATCVLTSCVDKRSKTLSEIKKLEEHIKSNPTTFDMYTGQKLVDAYLHYATLFPDDSVTPGLLFQASQLSLSIRNPKQSIMILDRIINKHKHFLNYPEVIVYKGFVYENELHMIDSAQVWYEYFLQHYPEHPLASDVEASLRLLGKSLDEIIETFLQNQIVNEQQSE